MEWSIDPKIEVKIPPLSIQTLVENAIQHGVLTKRSGGTVSIKVIQQGDDVTIEITDNGIGMDEQTFHEIMDDSRPKQGIGIANTNLRLKKLFGNRLYISSRLEHGTTVQFTVKKNVPRN